MGLANNKLQSAAQSQHRASTRFSTYSATPTLTPSVAPSHISSESTFTNDPRAVDIKTWNDGLERLNDKRLQQQRYVVTAEKSDDMSKLALGAKLDRALGRRMTGQDAVFTRVVGEKKVSA